MLVTGGALVPGLEEQALDPVAASVWGLVRSAQTEHPGRFVLVDIDREDSSLRTLTAALALDEPQLAIRMGAIRVPRLARGVSTAGEGASAGEGAAAGEGAPASRSAAAGEVAAARAAGTWTAEGTVLIADAADADEDGLGVMVARHLVREHGVRGVLLVGRPGGASAPAFAAEPRSLVRRSRSPPATWPTASGWRS